MGNGFVYTIVADGLTKIDKTGVNVASIMTDVAVDAWYEAFGQCRDAVMEILLKAGVDKDVLSKINNLDAGCLAR